MEVFCRSNIYCTSSTTIDWAGIWICNVPSFSIFAPLNSLGSTWLGCSNVLCALMFLPARIRPLTSLSCMPCKSICTSSVCSRSTLARLMWIFRLYLSRLKHSASEQYDCLSLLPDHKSDLTATRWHLGALYTFRIHDR